MSDPTLIGARVPYLPIGTQERKPTNPLRVLELVASSRGGGAVHVRDLTLGLDPTHFAAQVAMPQDGGNVLQEDFATIPFHQVDISGGLSPQALRQIRFLAEGLDILHVHGARAAFFGRLAAMSMGGRRPRVVYTIHGFAAPHYPPPKRQALLFLERWLARLTDAWICVSHAERDALLAAGIADAPRIRVIWNAIDLARFPDIQNQRREVRIAINVPADAFLVTTVCRLYRPRDFQTLLCAFRRVRDALPQAQLLIVGDGPLRAQIAQWVESLGLQDQVHLLGMRSDVPQLLAATDVFILSSRGWEGLPLTVLEAMASSLPVVASDVGGTGEAVIHQQTGYLFPPGDVAALADHLQTLASDPALARQMGRYGLARVNEFFTIQRMVRETAELYEQLLS
jgi:glycosyltransferase involved in cell wall biosynthesis